MVKKSTVAFQSSLNTVAKLYTINIYNASLCRLLYEKLSMEKNFTS